MILTPEFGNKKTIEMVIETDLDLPRDTVTIYCDRQNTASKEKKTLYYK